MTYKNGFSVRSHSFPDDRDPVIGERARLEMYIAFMSGYVRRINEATFNVTIGGIRIGSAKYTRLAQINLKSRIITFSRFAVENVPERGRRYLVLHELAHVKEASHNKRFWDFVSFWEPDYAQVNKDLQSAFRKNVKEDQKRQRKSLGVLPNQGPQLLIKSHFRNPVIHSPASQTGESDTEDESDWMEEEFEEWDGEDAGTVFGGSEED